MTRAETIQRTRAVVDLPYGAVMATAGASTLAGLCRLPTLVAPLLALAVLQALWIPVAAAFQHRRTLRPAWSRSWSMGPPTMKRAKAIVRKEREVREALPGNFFAFFASFADCF